MFVKVVRKDLYWRKESWWEIYRYLININIINTAEYIHSTQIYQNNSLYPGKLKESKKQFWCCALKVVMSWQCCVLTEHAQGIIWSVECRQQAVSAGNDELTCIKMRNLFRNIPIVLLLLASFSFTQSKVSDQRLCADPECNSKFILSLRFSLWKALLVG